MDPRTKTVLIVDDDEAMLNLLEILVRRDGFRVLRAETAEAAIRKMEHKPDAMLLDMMLPDANGLGIIKRLRQNQVSVPPVLIVTAYDTSQEVAQALKDPSVAGVISKPINQQKLLDQLHQILKTQPVNRK